uniref:Uncharacterized protein n=1 Tax=Chaetoceros debilis TaxID=122233 RepID=A0A7S3PW24_9STRA|mmetsp:Transcript_5760/g.8493  ORF Transcript_5760/g.8493 Transcript_5760/m.8493 type:complete len:126 (-) Transcript_5760:601-978(-)
MSALLTGRLFALDVCIAEVGKLDNVCASGHQSYIKSLKEINFTEVEGLLESASNPKEEIAPLPTPSGVDPVKTLTEKADVRLVSALSGSQQNLAISDPSLPENPIVCQPGFPPTHRIYIGPGIGT